MDGPHAGRSLALLLFLAAVVVMLLVEHHGEPDHVASMRAAHAELKAQREAEEAVRAAEAAIEMVDMLAPHARAAGWRFLSVEPRGGLTNQRIILRNSMVLARRSQRTLILPPWVKSRGKFDLAWDDQSRNSTSAWRAFPLSDVFNVPYLVTCAAKRGLRVRVLDPPPAWLAGELRPEGYPLDESPLLSPAAANGTAAVPAPTLRVPELVPSQLEEPAISSTPHLHVTRQILFARHLDNGVDEALRAEQEAMDECFTFAPRIVHAASLVSASLAAMGLPLTKLAFVHLRIEDDFTLPFGPGTAERVVYHAGLCMRHIGLPRETPPGDLTFRPFLACGEPLESLKLQELRDRYHDENLLNKDAVAPAFMARFRERWGEDITAAIDHLIGVGAAHFVGTGPSTFSQQVARERLRIGKESWNTVGGGSVNLDLEPVCRRFEMDSWPY